LKLWVLKPDEVKAERLPGLETLDGGIVAEHRGTSQRAVARERRGIEFFCVGNALFDSVASVAQDRVTGRVFGMAVVSPDYPVGNYLYLRARVISSDEAPTLTSISRRLRRIFFGRRVSAAYTLGERSPLSTSAIEDLVARALAGDFPARDLTRDELHRIVSESGDWPGYLVEMQEVFAKEARRRIEDRFGDIFATALEDIAREEKELKRSYTDSPKEAVANLERLADAIRAWVPEVDVLGVVAISR
jgi:hypothetical protein